jgi:hypothetical protein
MGLLCTREELDEMCRNGTELVHEAIDSGDPGAARAEFERIFEARAGLVDLMVDWTSTAIRWVLDTHGPEEMAKCFEPDLWLEIGLRAGVDSAEKAALARAVFAGGSEAAERFGALLDAGDAAGAKRFYAEVDAACLALHDYRIDWLSAVLNQIYRRHGAEGLAAAQLACANEEWWHGRMVGDLAMLGEPVERARNWSFFLGVGNWGTVSLTETEEAFVLHHQVCGSCGRQDLRGCFDPPLSFPRVTEDVPGLNFGNPRYSTYRTHLAVFHFVMPVGEVGHPWPDIDCRGMPGRCWFTIYKDPHDTPAADYERAGLVKPARA